MAISGDIGMEQICDISSEMYKSQMRMLGYFNMQYKLPQDVKGVSCNKMCQGASPQSFILSYCAGRDVLSF